MSFKEGKVKSEILRDMLSKSQNKTEKDDILTLASEIAGAPAFKLITTTESAMDRAIDIIFDKCYQFVVQDKHFGNLTFNELSRLKKEKEIWFLEFKKSFSSRVKSKQEDLESFIVNEIYHLDKNLYEQGWLRPLNLEGVDFVDLKASHKLVNDIQEAEQKLIKTLEKIRDAKLNCEAAKLGRNEVMNMKNEIESMDINEESLDLVYEKLNNRA